MGKIKNIKNITFIFVIVLIDIAFFSGIYPSVGKINSKILSLGIQKECIKTVNSNLSTTVLYDDQLDQNQSDGTITFLLFPGDSFAQSFIPNLGVLTRVELICSGYLKCSIRKSLTGKDLTTTTKKCDEQNKYWYTFDFPDINVTKGSIYYIVLKNIDEDESGGWGASQYDPYPRGCAWFNRGGSGWTQNVSVDFVFKTYGYNHKPNTPSNPTPEDGIKNASIETVLSWDGGDPDSDAVTYWIWFGPITPPPPTPWIFSMPGSQIRVTFDIPFSLNSNTWYYWRIIASDGTNRVDGPIWKFKTERINKNPQLSKYDDWPDGIDPNNGYVNTTFTFKVHYYDPDKDENGPSIKKLIINEDTDYEKKVDMNGNGRNANYTYSIEGRNLKRGENSYYFYFEDEYGGNARLPENGYWFFTVENRPPQLTFCDNWLDGVDPDFGSPSTKFTFKIHYYDPDGDPPLPDVFGGRKVVIDDEKYSMKCDGDNPSDADYSFQKSGFSEGTHNYHFEFIDMGGSFVRLPSTGEFHFTVENHPPEKPQITSGPTTVYRGEPYTYKTKTADPDGDKIQYYFDWGDGTGEWTDFKKSGETTSKSHSWKYLGTYEVKVKAKDTNGAESKWSDPLTINVVTNPNNNPPNKPDKPDGPSEGWKNIVYTFSTKATDPDGDEIYYIFKWDDNTETRAPERGYVESGTRVQANHSWSYWGSYRVRVKAVDINGLESPWSETVINIVNAPPKKPDKPEGKMWGINGKKYKFYTKTIDPDEDKIYYLFDWGDGSDSGWIGPYESGKIISATHMWSEGGSHKIKVKAKDIYGKESEWSETLKIIIIKEYSAKENSIILFKLLQITKSDTNRYITFKYLLNFERTKKFIFGAL